MFDNESEAKKVSVADNTEESRRVTMQTLQMVAAVIGVLAVAVVLAILVALLIFGKGEESTGGKFMGLQNPNKLGDPDAVTSQDIQDEYQARPEIPRETPVMIDTSVIKYLSYGDFSGLDDFIQEQMSLYKNVEGDDGQDMDDWRSQFEILRADVTKTMNLTKDTQPASTLNMYASPEVLAGAIAWSPVSVKLEAFMDWSSLILPPADQGEFINMKRAKLSAPHEMLAQINEISSERFYDLTAFDMQIAGYNLRLIIVGDQYGYYRPWTLQDLDGVMNRDIWTKYNLKQIRNALDPWTDFDSVLNLAQRDDSGSSDKERLEHPEWFDADGLYIGPDRDVPPGDGLQSNALEDGTQDASLEDGTIDISPEDEGIETNTDAAADVNALDEAAADSGKPDQAA